MALSVDIVGGVPHSLIHAICEGMAPEDMGSGLPSHAALGRPGAAPGAEHSLLGPLTGGLRASANGGRHPRLAGP